jgi:NADH:ubiquinone oxidoreductase subunit 5 (subunit L)/multisubunit Na+/H+ antiporter MnhA subunit
METSLRWLLGVPVAGGAVIYGLWILLGQFTRGSQGLRRGLAGLAKLIALVACALVLWQAVSLFRSGPQSAMTPAEDRAALGPLELALAWRADGLSSLVVLAASGIALLVVLYSFRAMAGADREPVYYAWVLWALAAVSAAALADTFLLLIVGWEIATVLLYLLVGMGTKEARAGAMKTFAMLGFADVCLLLGVGLWLASGGNALMQIGGAGAAPMATSTATAAAAFLLMAVGALAKAGAMPLHTWIPAAGESAPTPVFALLPAALDKLLGIYLLARITFDVFAIGGTLAAVLMVVGAATILLAVMMAMVQHNLKRLLAFHAVSQVGYMVLGLGCAAAALAAGAPMAVATVAFCGGLFHMLNHAIYKCTLFLTAGSVERVAQTAELDRLGGMARMLPVTFICCVVAALSISGVPPMNGFVSKWLVYNGALGVGTPLAIVCLVVAVFGSALTLASFVKVIHSVFLGTRGTAVPQDDQPRESFSMAVPMMVLAAACIFLGVGGNWAVGALILPAADAVSGVVPAGVNTEQALTLGEGGRQLGLWAPAPATVLILVGVVLGLIVYLATRVMRVRVVPNFVGGENDESDEQWHVSGTGFYETIRRMPAFSWAFKDASAGAFDAYRLTGRYGDTVVQRLRAWHTGLLAVYASWVLVGLVVLVVALAL